MKVIAAILLTSLLATSALEQPQAEDKTETDVRLTKFLLHTRENPDEPDILPHDGSSLGHFDSSRRTIVVMHGFSQNGYDSAKEMRDEFNKRGDFNVIFIEWGPLASWENYFRAAQNALNVGDYTAEFLANLMQASGLRHEDLQLYGFSLGGQGVGHMGRKLASLTGKKADRLTAMDPAEPYYGVMDPSIWVSKDDAEFVDIIHVNSDTLLGGGLSMYGPLGHVDFYPNGGLHQPGCDDILGLESGLIDFIRGGCSHVRGWTYFTESLNAEPGFLGTLCDSWEDFTDGKCEGNPQAAFGIGDHSEIVHGTYFMNVNEESPYWVG